VLDGDPGNLEDDNYNLKHSISKSEGFYYSGELVIANSSSKYKLSGYYHSGDFADVVNPLKTHNHNFGFYAIADQSIIRFSEDKKLNGFLQIGYAPLNRNLLDLYFGSGLNYYSPFNRHDDVVGVAFAYASLCKDYYNQNTNLLKRYEMAIEFSYTISLNKYITLQPNVQYVINPGMNKNYSNSLVTTLRLGISLQN